MGLAIELYFDAEAEQAVRQLRQRLTDNGVPPTLDLLGDRPHISLAGLPDHDAAPVIPIVEALATIAPFDLKLDGIGLFPTTEGVLFLAPTPTSALLDAHQRLYSALTHAHIAINPYYTPGSWIPHCTIASDLTPDELLHAVAICREAFTTIALTCRELGIIRFRPSVPIISFPLGVAI